MLVVHLYLVVIGDSIMAKLEELAFHHLIGPEDYDDDDDYDDEYDDDDDYEDEEE
jgi:hypothetical protein